MGSALSLLSMVRVTSARPSGGRPAVPAKMTSSILPPRSALAPCSPSTQAIASTTFDLPDPFGPTTAVIPGSSRSVVDDANDLKPFIVRDFRCTVSAPPARLRHDPSALVRRLVTLPARSAPAREAGGLSRVTLVVSGPPRDRLAAFRPPIDPERAQRGESTPSRRRPLAPGTLSRRRTA